MEEQELGYLAGQIASLILDSKRIVVFTGAGMSTESGLPDFRSPGGIWSKYDPDLFTYQKFVQDPGIRKQMWQMMVEFFLKETKPNAAHYAVAELEKLGKLDCVITQNVDNLHQKAGNSDDKVLQLHGNINWVVCLQCGQRYKIEEIQVRLEEGIEIPECDNCQGILKPDGVFFGEPLPERELGKAIYHSRNCELFLVIGSTLVVYPAAYMPLYALEAGAKLVIVNLSSTPIDHQAVVLIQTKAGETMPKVLEQVREGLS